MASDKAPTFSGVIGKPNADYEFVGDLKIGWNPTKAGKAQAGLYYVKTDKAGNRSLGGVDNVWNKDKSVVYLPGIPYSALLAQFTSQASVDRRSDAREWRRLADDGAIFPIRVAMPKNVVVEFLQAYNIAFSPAIANRFVEQFAYKYSTVHDDREFNTPLARALVAERDRKKAKKTVVSTVGEQDDQEFIQLFLLLSNKIGDATLVNAHGASIGKSGKNLERAAVDTLNDQIVAIIDPTTGKRYEGNDKIINISNLPFSKAVVVPVKNFLASNRTKRVPLPSFRYQATYKIDGELQHSTLDVPANTLWVNPPDKTKQGGGVASVRAALKELSVNNGEIESIGAAVLKAIQDKSKATVAKKAADGSKVIHLKLPGQKKTKAGTTTTAATSTSVPIDADVFDEELELPSSRGNSPRSSSSGRSPVRSPSGSRRQSSADEDVLADFD